MGYEQAHHDRIKNVMLSQPYLKAFSAFLKLEWTLEYMVYFFKIHIPESASRDSYSVDLE